MGTATFDALVERGEEQGCLNLSDLSEATQDLSEQEAQVPEQVEGEQVVEVQEATDPLTAEEVREAQEADTEQP